MPEVLGLDIGGANLKAATSDGRALTLPFPLWKQPEKLAGGIIELLVRLPHAGPIALTMTGELCDCFPSKKEGVRHILLAALKALPDNPLFIWRSDGKWASISHALEDPLPVAAANWLASATYSARYVPTGAAWFFDLGSTTLDMIPLLDGNPVPRGRTDLQRLRAGELAYLGSSRTPVTSLVQHFDIDTDFVTCATEFFATLDDALLILGYASEDELDHNTADGQPRTRRHALTRLARMACADPLELTPQQLTSMAEQVLSAFRTSLSQQLARAHTLHSELHTHPWGGFVTAGSGEGFLAEVTTTFANMGTDTTAVISMAGRVGHELSTALAAYSVAILLSERQAR